MNINITQKICSASFNKANLSNCIYKSLSLYLHLLLFFFITICPHTIYGNTSNFLPKYDEATVCKVLTEEVPELTANVITVLSNSEDHLVAEVNGEWIFRFPKTSEFISVFAREKRLLDRLRNCVSMPVPHYEYVGSKTAFVGYRKIPGEALLKDVYIKLSSESRQKVAESLALFLSQFHKAITLEEASTWGFGNYNLPLHEMQKSLPGTFSSNELENMIQQALSYAMQHPYDSKNRVILHHDLHGENFAFDVHKEQLTGVFDFSDALVGDYCCEFSKLFLIDKDLVIRVSKEYAILNNLPDPTFPSAVDFILRRASNVLDSRKTGNVEREAKYIKILQDFIPIWNSLRALE